MKVNSVNSSLYVNKNSNLQSQTPAFFGKECKHYEINSVYSNGKIGMALAGLTKIFHRNSEPEEVQAKKIVPYVLDSAYMRAGVISPKQAALTFRYGNADISEVKPEIVEKVKNNLKTMGIDEVDNNSLKLMKVADGDKEMVVYKRLSYYDEQSKKSIVFTPSGDMDYKVSYKYSSNGNIIDFDISDIYTDNTWQPM